MAAKLTFLMIMLSRWGVVGTSKKKHSMKEAKLKGKKVETNIYELFIENPSFRQKFEVDPKTVLGPLADKLYPEYQMQLKESLATIDNKEDLPDEFRDEDEDMEEGSQP